MINKECMLNFINHAQAIYQSQHTQQFEDQPAFKNALYGIKLFTVENNILNLLLPNKTKNKIGIRNMPFTRLLLLNDFKIDDYIVKGIIITKVIWPDGINSIKAYPLVQYNVIKKTDRFGEATFQYYAVDLRDINKIDDSNIYTENEELKWKKKDDIFSNNIRIFVCNFLDFLNNPEVQFIEVSRSEEQNMKRLKRGKPAIPPHQFITVTGKLKIYLDSLKENTDFYYSHRFWVRGHFRTLRSDKWKNKQGIKIWIPPFIKGKGILINKVYKVSK